MNQPNTLSNNLEAAELNEDNLEDTLGELEGELNELNAAEKNVITSIQKQYERISDFVASLLSGNQNNPENPEYSQVKGKLLVLGIKINNLQAGQYDSSEEDQPENEASERDDNAQSKERHKEPSGSGVSLIAEVKLGLNDTTSIAAQIAVLKNSGQISMANLLEKAFFHEIKKKSSPINNELHREGEEAKEKAKEVTEIAKDIFEENFSLYNYKKIQTATREAWEAAEKEADKLKGIFENKINQNSDSLKTALLQIIFTGEEGELATDTSSETEEEKKEEKEREIGNLNDLLVEHSIDNPDDFFEIIKGLKPEEREKFIEAVAALNGRKKSAITRVFNNFEESQLRNTLYTGILDKGNAENLLELNTNSKEEYEKNLEQIADKSGLSDGYKEIREIEEEHQTIYLAVAAEEKATKKASEIIENADSLSEEDIDNFREKMGNGAIIACADLNLRFSSVDIKDNNEIQAENKNNGLMITFRFKEDGNIFIKDENADNEDGLWFAGNTNTTPLEFKTNMQAAIRMQVRNQMVEDKLEDFGGIGFDIDKYWKDEDMLPMIDDLIQIAGSRGLKKFFEVLTPEIRKRGADAVLGELEIGGRDYTHNIDPERTKKIALYVNENLSDGFSYEDLLDNMNGS